MLWFIRIPCVFKKSMLEAIPTMLSRPLTQQYKPSFTKMEQTVTNEIWLLNLQYAIILTPAEHVYRESLQAVYRYQKTYQITISFVRCWKYMMHFQDTFKIVVFMWGNNLRMQTGWLGILSPSISLFPTSQSSSDKGEPPARHMANYKLASLSGGKS